MYERTRAIYSLGDIETGCVESKRGVKQGCVIPTAVWSIHRGTGSEDKRDRFWYKSWE